MFVFSSFLLSHTSSTKLTFAYIHRKALSKRIRTIRSFPGQLLATEGCVKKLRLSPSKSGKDTSLLDGGWVPETAYRSRVG